MKCFICFSVIFIIGSLSVKGQFIRLHKKEIDSLITKLIPIENGHYSISKGTFQDSTLTNGIVSYYSKENRYLFERKVTHGILDPDIYQNGIIINQTDSVGKRQGKWLIFARQDSDFSRLAQKGYTAGTLYKVILYKDGSYADSAKTYYPNGVVKNLDLFHWKNQDGLTYIEYYPSGNIKAQTYAEVPNRNCNSFKYYSYSDTSFHCPTKLTFKNKSECIYKHCKMISKTTKQFERMEYDDEFEIEGGHHYIHQKIPYQKQEGEFKNEILFNGYTSYYDCKHELAFKEKTENGNTPKQPTLLFKDSVLLSVILGSPSCVDVNKNKQIETWEATRINELVFVAGGIKYVKDISELRLFKNLKTLVVLGKVIPINKSKTNAQIYAEIKAIPFSIHPHKGHIFDFVQTEPYFPGGATAFQQFVSENLEIPPNTAEYDLGTVYVQFVVNTDGSLEQIKIMRGLTKQIDLAVLKMIKKMPPWVCGKHNYIPVRSKFIIPVKIRQ